jgi:hypothetical protein
MFKKLMSVLTFIALTGAYVIDLPDDSDTDIFTEEDCDRFLNYLDTLREFTTQLEQLLSILHCEHGAPRECEVSADDVDSGASSNTYQF